MAPTWANGGLWRAKFDSSLHMSADGPDGCNRGTCRRWCLGRDRHGQYGRCSLPVCGPCAGRPLGAVAHHVHVHRMQHSRSSQSQWIWKRTSSHAGITLEQAISHGVASLMLNSGQSCSAPTRRNTRPDRLIRTRAWPVASRAQWEKIQGLIQQAIEEGATLVTAGPGRPDGLDTGYYVRPTIFADVTTEMVIAREEVFGPML